MGRNARAYERLLRVFATLSLVAALMVPPAALAWGAPSGAASDTAPEKAEKAEKAEVVTLPEGADANAVDNKNENTVNPQQQPDSSFIYDVSIADLANADSYMDGQTVQVVGEAVGDLINAETSPDYCWAVVASQNRGMDGNVSVYLLKSQAGVIDTLGAYGKTGTTVRVRGTFNLVCQEHSGITDLHADSVSAVQEGETVRDEFDVSKLYVGLGLMVAGVLLAIAFRVIRERSM